MLIQQIMLCRPLTVIVAIGGAVQERLGLALKRSLSVMPTPPGIVRIGAAMGFLEWGTS